MTESAGSPRSMVGNLQLMLDLDRIGVETISLRERWLQLGSPVRSLLIAVFSWVAEEQGVRSASAPRPASRGHVTRVRPCDGRASPSILS